MIILGIDPGYAIVGYGIIEQKGNKCSPIAYGVITTATQMPMEQRLLTIYRELNNIIDKYKPDEVAIEELFFNTNAKTAINVGQGRGVCLLAAAEKGIPINEYTPLQIKQALTGYGRADKNQIQQMVKMFLNLTEIPKPDDAADAVAVAVCHAHSRAVNNLVKR